MENTSLTPPFIQEGSIIVHHFQLHFWSFLSMAADLIKSGTTKHTHTHSFHVWPHCCCEPIKSNYWLIQRYELGSCVWVCVTHTHTSTRILINNQSMNQESECLLPSEKLFSFAANLAELKYPTDFILHATHRLTHKLSEMVWVCVCVFAMNVCGVNFPLIWIGNHIQSSTFWVCEGILTNFWERFIFVKFFIKFLLQSHWTLRMTSK